MTICSADCSTAAARLARSLSACRRWAEPSSFSRSAAAVASQNAREVVLVCASRNARYMAARNESPRYLAPVSVSAVTAHGRQSAGRGSGGPGTSREPARKRRRRPATAVHNSSSISVHSPAYQCTVNAQKRPQNANVRRWPSAGCCTSRGSPRPVWASPCAPPAAAYRREPASVHRP